MRRTRACKELFVPGLLALRVKLDRPAGIRARHEADGHEAILALAKQQFDADWSEDAIASNCQKLSERAPEDQERIVAPDRKCLATEGCRAFVDCDLAGKEERWTKAR